MKKSMSKKVICLVIVGAMLTPSVVYASDTVKKDESVFVNLKQNGAQKETIVSNWIHSDSPIGEINDASQLDNIKNIKGEEQPNKNGNVITWKTDKKDIFYTGNTNLEIPENVKITYFLNDSEISPEDIAGKDGTVKIKINFENKAKHTVTVNGKEKEIYTPMSTIAVVNLPSDTFSNVTAKDGQIVSEGNNQIVTFIAFPGMKESLGLDKLDTADINLNLPEELEITAEAKKFKMGSIFVTATPMLPDVKAFKNAKNLDELTNGIDKLKEAVNEMSKGSKELNNGVNTARYGSYQIRDGVGLAKDKIDNLKVELAKNTSKLDLIKDNNKVNAERELLNDARVAMNMDTSMLNDIPGLMTPQNKLFLQKCMNDYSVLDTSSLDPILKSLPSMVGPENMKKIGKLLQDTENLSNIDMTKIAPMISLLNNAPELKGLLGQAVELNKNVNVQQIQGIIGEQQKQGQEFIKNAAIVDTKNNKDALKNAVKTSKISAEIQGDLIKVIDSYSALVSGTKDNILKSGDQLKAMTLTLTELGNLQNTLNSNPKLIQGLNLALSDANINYLKAIFPQIQAMQQDLEANKNNLAVASSMLQKMNDPEVQKTINEIKVLQQDAKKAKPMIEKIKGSLTPDTMAKLEKSPQMIAGLISMQKDLKDNAKILEVVQDALKDGNVKKAQQLIAAVPTLTDKVNQLYDGSAKLADGMGKLSEGSKKLSDGIDKFNEEGVKKVDSKVSPVIENVDDVLATKDELVKLSDENKSFSGIGKDMDGTVKFIMKTDEIKVPEVKIAKKTVKKEEKFSFIQWIKNLFS